jgi:hypothetical protein
VKFKAGKIMRQRVEKLSRELKEAAERPRERCSQEQQFGRQRWNGLKKIKARGPLN